MSWREEFDKLIESIQSQQYDFSNSQHYNFLVYSEEAKKKVQEIIPGAKVAVLDCPSALKDDCSTWIIPVIDEEKPVKVVFEDTTIEDGEIDTEVVVKKILSIDSEEV